MGVPFFYSWIVKRFPFIKQEIFQNRPYIDCLYMDLNCIIYKCVKDEGTFLKEFISAKEFDEIWIGILNALNELINLIQPRKLLFLTFDGVAPRAKMNHQRNRRFKSGKSHSETKNLTKNLSNNGIEFIDETFINNSISPGTHFMTELNKAMKFFIQRKFYEDDKWKDVKVIYSGSDVAGEGEHKIFDLIRKLHEKKVFQEWDTHCIYGNDADLIMLSLCSHLQNILILRETFVFKKKFNRGAKRFQENPKFEIVNIKVLRDCLETEFQDVKKKMDKNFAIKNIIDDFIFICFFIGNDFLPKMFCFDIRKGYLEKLINLFKEFLVETNGYLIKNARINFQNFEKILKKLAGWEMDLIGDKVSHSREIVEENKRIYNSESESEEEINGTFENLSKKQIEEESKKVQIKESSNENKKGLLKNLDFLENFLAKYHSNRITAKSFYYNEKLKFDASEKEGIKKIYELIKKYIEGVQFVLLYYYEGCPSWNWFYPHYYAPLISDIHEYLKYMNEKKVTNYEFQLGKPFPAFKQLLLIMPIQSIDLLPNEFAHLIEDEQHSILRTPIDYYPINFEIDPNDAYFESEFIAILPFLEEELLEKAYQSVDLSLMKEEVKERMKIGSNLEYSYSKKGEQRKVSSFLPNYCPDFEAKIQVHEFLFEDLKEGKIMIHFIIRPEEEKMRDSYKYRIPTLHYINPLSGRLKKQVKRPLCDTLTVRMPDLTINEAESYLLLKKNVTVVFPTEFDLFSQFEGEVIGFINPEFLTSTKPLQFFEKYPYNKQYHQDIYRNMCQNLIHEFERLNFQITKPFSTLFFVSKKNYFGRKNNGEYKFENEDYLIPPQMISKTQLWPYLNEIIPSKLQHQLGCKVLILKHNMYQGYLGKIIGTVQNNKVKIIVHKSSSTTINSIEKHNEKKKSYIPLKLFCKMLNVEISTILIILDSLIVNLSQKSDLFDKFGATIDIGLNIINKDFLRIVPELVICKKIEEGFCPNKRDFELIELSEETVDLVKEYQKNFPSIFAFINAHPRLYYNATDFQEKNSKFDANVEIVKIYVWIMKQINSSLVQVPLNSKVLARSEVSILENEPVKKTIKSEREEIEINTNFIFAENHHSYIAPYYRNHPHFHKLKDRVISLKTTGYSDPPFGSFGTVIGILDMKIEVLFDEPFIGGGNLGGRCKYWRGALMNFIDVFNLDNWGDCLEERSSVGNRSKGWNYYIDHYIPKFDEKIISSKELNKKNSNPNYNVFNNLKQKSQKTTAPNETPKIMSKNNNNTNGQKNEVSPQVSKEELSKQLIQALKPDGNSQKLIELETQNSKIENNIILKKKMSSQAEAFIPNLSEPKE